MNQETGQARQVILLLKGVLAEQGPELQAEAKQLIADIKAMRDGHPTTWPLAIAIIGAELSAEP